MNGYDGDINLTDPDKGRSCKKCTKIFRKRRYFRRTKGFINNTKSGR